jgi:hypothetical protein
MKLKLTESKVVTFWIAAPWHSRVVRPPGLRKGSFPDLPVMLFGWLWLDLFY